MIFLSLQTLLLVAAGFGLLRLWRVALPRERWLQFIVAAGFLTRAVAGQILFWISWARLPIARSLQFGGGYWLFAQDARFYVWRAGNVAGEGLRAIATYDRAAASPTYVQILAIAEGLLGSVPCVGLLLNLFCYLGAVALLVRWMRIDPRTRIAAAIAIAALSLSPGIVLWSLSALKESLFQFLFVAFIAACAAWQRAWMTSERWTRRAGIAVLIAILLYALAGLRWYFAFVLMAIASLFMLLVAFQAVGRRAAAFASAAVVAVILSQSLLTSAAEYMPATLRAVLTPATTLQATPRIPHAVVAAVEQARQAFDTTTAKTAIQSGARLHWTKSAPAPAPKRVEPAPASVVAAAPPPPPMASASVVTPPPATTTTTAPAKPVLPKVIPIAPPPPEFRAALDEADAASIRKFLVDQAGAWNSDDFERYMSSYWNSPDVELKIGPTSYVGWPQIRDYVEPQRRKGTITLSGVELSAWPSETIFARMQWTWTSIDGEHKYDGESKAVLRKFPDGWKIVRARIPLQSAESAPPAVATSPASEPVAPVAQAPAPVVSAPQPIAKKTPAPTPAPAAVPAPPPQGSKIVRAEIRRPHVAAVARRQSRAESLLTGAAALVVPRAVGERLGVFHIGGGRGMLWFTDVDTVVFDLILIVAVIALTGRPRAHWRNPLTWLVLLITILIALPLAYSISNFGTLFRLREIVYLGLILTPLAVASSRSVPAA